MLSCVKLAKKIFFLFTLILPSVVFAQTDWSRVSNGEHSYKALEKPGESEVFYKDVPVKKIEGAELVLFNYRLAESMGLYVPSDWKALEKLVLDQFAYMKTEPDEKADKTWFASYYDDERFLDDPGRATGDGRAAFTGEVTSPGDNGTLIHMDVMIKGMGATGLGWKSLIDHKDGLLVLPKAIQSFIQSEIAFRNKLEGTVDLAVIKLPFSQKSPIDGSLTQASLSVRVGNQFRPAHFISHLARPKRLKKVFDYLLKRDWGLESKDFLSGLEQFSKSMGEQSARYTDLNAIHVSPIISNRTTKGTNIDVDSLRFIDAYHGDFHYNSNINVPDGIRYYQQNQVFKDYIKSMVRYAKIAGYSVSLTQEKKLLNVFHLKYESILTDLWLLRLGLSKAEVSILSLDVKKDFFHIVSELYQKKGNKNIYVENQKFKPAAYFMRKIFKNSLQVFESSKRASVVWEDLFNHNKDWKTLEASDSSIIADAGKYSEIIGRIMNELPQDKIIQDLRFKRAEDINRNNRDEASLRLSQSRVTRNASVPYFKRYLSRVSNWVAENELSAQDLNRKVEAVIVDMVDKGLPDPITVQSTVSSNTITCSKIL